MYALCSTRVFKFTVSLALAAALALTLALILSTAAYSQTSDAQYGSPVNPVGEVLDAGEMSSVNIEGAAGTEGSVSSGGSALVALLPETGGSLLFFAALLGCALVGSGLLILRRVSR